MGLTLLASCSDDDDALGFIGQTKTFELSSVADPTIFGTATFIQNVDNSTTVELQLAERLLVEVIQRTFILIRL
jgi:hypothetical protein